MQPLDDEQRWYRYHHLFAEVLRGQGRAQIVGATPELHRRAAAWYERAGLVLEAVDHALGAPDHERAARLIEEHLYAMLQRGGMVTLRGWVDRLPRDLLHAHPRLDLFEAWVLFYTSQRDQLDARLAAIERRWRGAADTAAAPEDDEISGAVATLRGSLAFVRGELLLASEWCRRSSSSLPAANTFWREMALPNLGRAAMYSGELGASQETFMRAGSAARSTVDIPLLQVSLDQLAQLRELQGDLIAVAAYYRQELATTGDAPPHHR